VFLKKKAAMRTKKMLRAKKARKLRGLPAT
jgi:hypothetical protein